MVFAYAIGDVHYVCLLLWGRAVAHRFDVTLVPREWLCKVYTRYIYDMYMYMYIKLTRVYGHKHLLHVCTCTCTARIRAHVFCTCITTLSTYFIGISGILVPDSGPLCHRTLVFRS